MSKYHTYSSNDFIFIDFYFSVKKYWLVSAKPPRTRSPESKPTNNLVHTSVISKKWDRQMSPKIVLSPAQIAQLHVATPRLVSVALTTYYFKSIKPSRRDTTATCLRSWYLARDTFRVAVVWRVTSDCKGLRVGGGRYAFKVFNYLRGLLLFEKQYDNRVWGSRP